MFDNKISPNIFANPVCNDKKSLRIWLQNSQFDRYTCYQPHIGSREVSYLNILYRLYSTIKRQNLKLANTPPPHNNNNNNNKTEVDEKSWLLFPYGLICFSTFYDPFVDVTLWDIYEATCTREFT